MKVSCYVLLALVAASALVHAGEDKTITKVVKLLQEMMEKSKEEAKAEKTLYGKFKCYCDTNDEEKSTQIAELSKMEGLLDSAIDNLQASNGGLSAQTAQFKADMAENEKGRTEAQNIRDKANKAFLAEEADLTQAVGQMDEAIKTLAAIGADQTLGKSAADHEKFMAGVKTKSPLLLSALGSEVKTALQAASIFLSPEQKKTVGGFLQGPSFTGTYTAQSGQIVGILKDMRDTFKTNLADAKATEEKDAKAHTAFIETKENAFKAMEATYKEKQETLSSNDQALTSKKKQLQASTKDREDAEVFLTKLGESCAAKAKEYEERNLMRANEDAAISQAISILNSDSAFEAFGTVSATSTGATAKASSFLQRGRSSETVVRHELERVLRVEKSARLEKVLAAVEAGNPFETVLVEIEKMVKLAESEGKEDKKNLDWCKSERDENNENLQDRKDDILSLEGETDKLDTTINDPVKGLKEQLKSTEASLVQNNEAQISQTKQRTEENVAYQADIRNLVNADDLLDKAIVVLSKYYEELQKRMDAAAMVQEKKQKEDPAPPETFDKFKGQSGKGGDAISMLKFIQSETKKEENTAHSEEEKGQHAYEDSMTDLKTEQAKSEESLTKLNEDLATAEKTLIEKTVDLKDGEAAKASIETYLTQIKPGCDFITNNFDLREKNRETEVNALNKAVVMIKKTPAYAAAVQAAKEEGYGKCKDKCVASESDAKCKACLAGVTVPAYCAGHSGTPGC
jgi:hypothetical protein